jgi:hypothetical protein
MIAASGPDAIRRGEYEFVLGELHIGTNMMNAPVFLDQHPAPEELLRAFDNDLPEPRVVAVTSKHWPAASSRLHPSVISPKDFRLELNPGAYPGLPSQALPIGELVMEEHAGKLIVRTRDGRLSFDVIEACADVMKGQVVNNFKLLQPRSHLPRISIDRLIVCRESWAFPPAEIAFAQVKDEVERFVAARRWARANRMPRFVFAKSPVEVKPFYVDFGSPVYVDTFAKIVRRSMENLPEGKMITISEMVPDHNQIWLPDNEGRRYTSELRIVAVDLAG